MNKSSGFIRDRQNSLILSVFCLLLLTISPSARTPKEALGNGGKAPAADKATAITVEYTAHNRGNIQLAVANNGSFGTLGGQIPDPFTGDAIPSCIYPRESNIVYLWVGALWVGAVVGRDTLVSCADEDFYITREFWPTDEWLSDPATFQGFQYKSIDEASTFYSDDARSEEDILCEYDDARTDPNLVNPDPTDRRNHKPLNIKVTQRTMAWSYDYADDFVLFDYEIKNNGLQELESVYLGIFVDGDIWHVTRNGPEGWNDDLAGFLRSYPSPDGDGTIDTVNIAYHADNDGDPAGNTWDERSALGVVGTKVVRTPSDSLHYSYNWWRIDYSDPTRDFGPRRRGTALDPFRDFGTRLGTPEGDRNKYYVLRHEEFDYDLIYTAIDHSQEGWLPPPENAEDYAMGYDVRYLLSFGPFNVNPGEKLPITFAWVGGEDLHKNPEDFLSHNPAAPDIFYNKLDFSSLTANARWASWVYDNPGVDTDDNGYYGKFRLRCFDSTLTDTGYVYDKCDTFYYEGDGVPDFRGASPPAAPEFSLLPEVGALTVRFNGLRSETYLDQFSREVDFEGYRIYFARDDRPSSFSLLASYDRENYNKYVYNINRLPEPGYELIDIPFTIDELRCLYGDSCGDTTFDPTRYSRSFPYVLTGFPESTFYFVPQDFNASELGKTTPIRKRFPDQPYPSSLNPDSALANELTDEDHFKYFEYEYRIEALLPTIPYYVNVTAFDYGSPKSGLKSLETPVSSGAQLAYPQTSVDVVEAGQLDAYVYPNPYLADGSYEETGFENRDGTLAIERARLLHFANLPRVCTISIYSIDGDLIKSFEHNFPNGGPEAMHDTWNLITRNTQATVSGIYYFVIESDGRTQIGKFVIIK